MSDLRTLKVVVLPMMHLTPHTIARLDGPDLDWPVAGGKVSGGFLVYAHDENSGVGRDAIPIDLWACCGWANARGFDYIQFDRDLDGGIEGIDVSG